MFRLLQRIKRYIRSKLNISKPRSSYAPRHPRWGYKITGLVLLTALIVAIYPFRMTFLPISVPKLGDIATEDIVAPIDFPVEKSPEVIQSEIEEVKRSSPLVLEFNESSYDTVSANLDSLFANAIRLKAGNTGMSNGVRRLRLLFPEFNQNTLERLMSLDSLAIHHALARSALEDIYYAGILPEDADVRNLEYQNVIITRSTGRTPLKRDQLVSMGNVEEAAARAYAHPDSNIRALIGRVISKVAAPTLTPDYTRTERERTLRIARIPREELSFKAGDVIVRRNQKVEPVHVKWLDALAKHRLETEEKASLWQFILPVLARAAFIGFILSIFVSFLYYFKRRMTFSNLRYTAILFIILLQILLNFLIDFELELSFYLIPFAIGALLFAILFDLQIGLMATLTLALIAGVLNNFDFSHTFTAFSVGAVACFSVRIVRKRADFYRSILYISITYLALIYFVESLRFTEPDQMAVDFGFGILNAVLSPILVMGFLPIFESIFNFTTDITLLELSDMNHPLLRRLAIEAPGTYHHSIIVGNLSEKAAEAIGANSLLARVGSYYHDIGKMEISEYFVENQSGIRNKHEKLTPNMSALIIGSHVKKGVEMAEAFDLPDKISEFIEEHHGTTLMSYFYNKATEEKTEEADLSEDDFRYPGPRPNSRETAIVMLADSVEAASRTLEDPKPSRIRNLIKRIINDKFQSGQLASSALTMHDLELIENSFANMLYGVFHARIDYPQKEEEEE